MTTVLSPILPLLIVYAAAGLILSLAVHVLSFFDITLGGESLFFALHVGIFPLWMIVVLIMQRAMTGMTVGSGWGFQGNAKLFRIFFAGCPVWIKVMTMGFFVYAFVNFVVFVFLAPSANVQGTASPIMWHGFSGHWMAFYSAGLAMLVTSYRIGLDNLRPQCPNGHAVAWGDRFCATCGATLSARVQNGL